MITQAMRIFLTGMYLILAAFGVVTIAVGEGPVYLILVAVLYVCTAIALNNKGGAWMKIIAFLTSAILTAVALGSVLISVYSGYFDHRFEAAMFLLGIIFGAIGLATLHVLRNSKTMTTLG